MVPSDHYFDSLWAIINLTYKTYNLEITEYRTETIFNKPGDGLFLIRENASYIIVSNERD